MTEAGILLKMGAYGLIRINMELLPHAHYLFSPWKIEKIKKHHYTQKNSRQNATAEAQS